VIYDVFPVRNLLVSYNRLYVEHSMNNDLCLDARDSHLAQCKSVENDAVFGLAVADPYKHVFLSPENVAGGTLVSYKPAPMLVMAVA